MMRTDAAPRLGTPRVASDDGYFLAEGPVWDPLRDRLLWVDILAGHVYRGRLDDDGTVSVVDRLEVPGTAGAVAVAESGELVVAGTHQLVYVGADGTVSSKASDVVAGDDRRLNDGKPDPAGRFVVGTKGPSASEHLLRFEADGGVTVIDDDLTLSNGLCWTADGRGMYSIDTLTRRVFVRDYDAVTGATGRRSVFLAFDDAYPDGMTIDAEDHLWVALWGAGRVVRVSPEGRIVGRIDVPAPHTSCVTFAGAGRDTVVITTARENLSAEQLARHPLSGRLFTVECGIAGPEPRLWDPIGHPAPLERKAPV